jgi:hypothetical protein
MFLSAERQALGPLVKLSGIFLLPSGGWADQKTAQEEGLHRLFGI